MKGHRGQIKQIIQTESHSELQISPKDGIKSEGFISWAVLGAFIFIAVFYINAKYGYGKKIKDHVVKKYKSRKKRK